MFIDAVDRLDAAANSISEGDRLEPRRLALGAYYRTHLAEPEGGGEPVVDAYLPDTAAGTCLQPIAWGRGRIPRERLGRCPRRPGFACRGSGEGKRAHQRTDSHQQTSGAGSASTRASSRSRSRPRRADVGCSTARSFQRRVST